MLFRTRETLSCLKCWPLTASISLHLGISKDTPRGVWKGNGAGRAHYRRAAMPFASFLRLSLSKLQAEIHLSKLPYPGWHFDKAASLNHTSNNMTNLPEFTCLLKRLNADQTLIVVGSVSLEATRKFLCKICYYDPRVIRMMFNILCLQLRIGGCLGSWGTIGFLRNPKRSYLPSIERKSRTRMFRYSLIFGSWSCTKTSVLKMFGH